LDAFGQLSQLKIAATTQLIGNIAGAGGGMSSSDWLTIVWLVVTAFLAALLGYVLLHTM
jgi:hypothetical protein